MFLELDIFRLLILHALHFFLYTILGFHKGLDGDISLIQLVQAEAILADIDSQLSVLPRFLLFELLVSKQARKSRQWRGIRFENLVFLLFVSAFGTLLV